MKPGIQAALFATPGLRISLLWFFIPSFSFAKMEETTDTKVMDSQFKGGYTQKEMDDMPKEQRAILKKFMEGRYSSANDGASRYGGILESHDNNRDGKPDHETSLVGGSTRAENASEKISAGQVGLTGDARDKALAISRITESGNCELTKTDQDNIKAKKFGDIRGAVVGESWTSRQLVETIVGKSWNTLLDVDSSGTPFNKHSQFLQDNVTPNPVFATAQAALDTYYRGLQKQGYFPDGATPGKYRMRCANISALVLDKGSAHGADIGEGHRVNTLNEKFFKSDDSAKGPYAEKASGEAVDVAKQYVTRTISDSGTTAIPPEVIAAMRAQGMNISASADGKQVTITNSNGTETLNVGASPDDLKSEFAWNEAQKKFHINNTWKMLRAERFLQGSNYDPTKVSNEIGSLLARTENVGKSDLERDKIVADKVAEHKSLDGELVYMKATLDLSKTRITQLGRPEAFPSGSFETTDSRYLTETAGSSLCNGRENFCYVAVRAGAVRNSGIARNVPGFNAADVSDAALAAAKQAVEGGNPNTRRANEERRAYISKNIAACMGRDQWCKEVPSDATLCNFDNTVTAAGSKKGFTPESCKMGVAFVDIAKVPGEDIGNAFKDTREFIAVKMETAMDGPLANFMNVIDGARGDFSAAIDAKTGTNNYAIVKKQWDLNMQMAKDVREYADEAYNDCLRSRGKNCKKQFDDDNFNVKTKNTVQLFGRDTARDGLATGTEATQLVTEDPGIGGGQSSGSAGALGLPPRAPASTPLPARGSAPASVSSPFSLN